MPTTKQCRRIEFIIANNKPVYLNAAGQSHYIDLAARTTDAISVLDKEKANLVAAYLGIHGHAADLSLEQIGKSLPKPISKQAVFQHLQHAARKLNISFDMRPIISTYFTPIGALPWEE